MGLAGQNQVRHMYVGNAPAATVTDLATLKSAGVANDLVLLGADGAAVAAGSAFKLYAKDALGNVISSDTIKADNVLHVKSVAYTAPTLKLVTISALTVDANSLYTVNIEIQGHGSLSPEDTYLKQGFYKAVAGNDQEDIVDGLIASLNRNFSREVGATATTNRSFTFAKTGTGASAALTVEGKLDANGFDGDKKISTYNRFIVDIHCTTYPTVTITTPGSDGVGTGYQVVEMEYYLLGERGDTYRKNGYPFNIVGPDLASSVSGSYDLIEIAYFDEGRDEAKKSKKGLTIAIPTAAAPNANVNGVVADLNTILGAGSVDTIKAA
mgnify:CR=1 FL=1|jgi:hypothetical protein|tara:strand:+ start:259 stop:1233 length:975 start_codon:yes stop_codon:yes gene_type:complete